MNFVDKIKVRLKNCFISIVIKDNSYFLLKTIITSGKIIASETKNFKIIHKGEMPVDFVRYIESLRKEHRFLYINFLFGGVSQGMIADANYDTFRKFNLDPSSLDLIHLQHNNAVYTSSNDITTIVEQFKDIGGIDLIYSPFVILQNLIEKQDDGGCILYLLNFDEFITICIHNKKKFLFGVFFKIGSSEGIVDDGMISSSEEYDDELIEEDDEADELISLDDIDDVDDIDDIADIDDMDDFGSDEGFDDFEGGDSDEEEPVEEETREAEDIGRDIIMLKYLKSSIQEFYANEIYNSDFIEKIVVFESSPISKEIIYYVENDLLLQLEIHKIDILKEAAIMSFKEAYHG